MEVILKYQNFYQGWASKRFHTHITLTGVFSPSGHFTQRFRCIELAPPRQSAPSRLPCSPSPSPDRAGDHGIEAQSSAVKVRPLIPRASPTSIPHAGLKRNASIWAESLARVEASRAGRPAHVRRDHPFPMMNAHAYFGRLKCSPSLMGTPLFGPPPESQVW